jgi:hypothetical protein
VATQIKAFKAITCSAKMNVNIENVFDLAVKAVIHNRGGKCTIA